MHGSIPLTQTAATVPSALLKRCLYLSLIAVRSYCLPHGVMSDHFELIGIRRRRTSPRAFFLVPERRRGDVVLQRQVAAARRASRAPGSSPADPLEADRVHDVPAVQAEALLAAVQAVRVDHLAACPRKGVVNAPYSPGRARRSSRRRRSSPRCRCRRSSGTRSSPSRIELDLALAPPAAVVHAPGQVGADVWPLPATPSRRVWTSLCTAAGCCGATARGSRRASVGHVGQACSRSGSRSR